MRDGAAPQPGSRLPLLPESMSSMAVIRLTWLRHSGPSIGPCCYTVGAELMEAFRGAGQDHADLGRWFRHGERLQLDLWTANRDQLEAAGVPASAIHVSGLCTACHPDWFYSYRREGAAAGRLVGFIRAPSA